MDTNEKIAKAQAQIAAATLLQKDLLEETYAKAINKVLEQIAEVIQDENVNNGEAFLAIVQLMVEIIIDSPEPPVTFTMMQLVMKDKILERDGKLREIISDSFNAVKH